MRVNLFICKTQNFHERMSSENVHPEAKIGIKCFHLTSYALIFISIWMRVQIYRKKNNTELVIN